MGTNAYGKQFDFWIFIPNSSEWLHCCNLMSVQGFAGQTILVLSLLIPINIKPTISQDIQFLQELSCTLKSIFKAYLMMLTLISMSILQPI